MVKQTASERRGSVRHPITLAATLEVESAGRWSCQIVDFCSEGLFLQYSGETSCRIRPYFVSVMPPVRVIFRDPEGARYFSLDAQPVRCIDGALGVQFIRPAPAAIAALMRLRTRVGSDPVSERGGERAATILRLCKEETLRFVRPLVASWLKTVDQRLNDCARNAGNDRQAHQFMDASARLRSGQEAFWQLMSQALLSPVLESAARQSAATDTRLQLNLVAKGEFEDWLLLRVLVTKAENQFRSLLLPLKMRLDKAGVMLQSGHQNPLGPVLVCDAFRQAQEHLGCERPVNKVAFQVFEQEVVCHLEGLYSNLNQILIRQGILPELDLNRCHASAKPADRRVPRQTATRPQLAAAAQAPAGKSTILQPNRERAPARKASTPTSPCASAALHQSLSHAQSAFATVERLLTVLRQSRTAREKTAGLDPEAKPLSLPDLQRELGSISGSAGKPSALSLKQRVIDQVSRLDDRRLEPEQEARVDVVDQFFISLQQSPRLDAAAWGQLQRLDVPVLRAVLEKRHDFEDEDSPVRGVLNRIAQLSARGARPNPVLQRKVDNVIERIHQDFDRDAHVFRSALTELDELVERQNLAYRRSVERVTAAAEGTQKVEDAKATVAQELDRRLAGQQVPRALVTLLNGGWRDLLSLTVVRQGADSSLWRDYIGIVDTLMALTRDPETSIDLPELLRIIQDGLATVSSNQTPAGQIRDELKRFLTRRDRDPAMLIEMPPRAEDDRCVPEQLSESRQRRLQRWMSRAQGLQIGDWMKMQKDPDNPSYMRLVWVGRGFSRFVFVNHQGMKVVELDLLQLASHLQKGIVVSDPGYERPIVDESIDRMVQQVYEQTALASTQDELTGLPSRRAFERFLTRWQQANAGLAATRTVEGKALAVLELQQLRTVSHRAGFRAGDQALCQVANLLRTLTPADAGLARLGGARFALLLDAAAAEAQVRLLMERIAGLSLMFAGEAHSLSATIGLALDQPGLATPEQWLSGAEEVLVGLRQRGESGWAWYAPESEQVSEQARIAAKISVLENLDRERVLLRRQKLLPLHGDTLMGVQHQVTFSLYDDYGRLIHGPGFVRMAERQNRIQLVDRWLVGHMLDWMTRNPKAVENLGGLGISLSGQSLNDATLLEFIFERMSQKKGSLEHLWFEIAEAALTGSPEQVAEFIPELRDLGCRFCLGGFSGRREAYALLKRLPIDRVKLDGSFLTDLLRSEADRAAVRSIVEMTHFLGREVIACPVEDRGTFQLLCELGIDYAQGYAVEAPRPLED